MPDELTPLERQVLKLSLNDRLSSLMPQSRMTLWLFGPRAVSLPLANSRLEALRRYAVLSRFIGKVPPRGERDRLDAAGFGAGQIEAIDTVLAPRRGQSRFRARLGRKFRRAAGNRAPDCLPPSTGPAPGYSLQSTHNSIAKENMPKIFPTRTRLALTLMMLPFAIAPAAVQAQSDPGNPPPQGPMDGEGGPGGPGGPGGGDQFIVGVGGMYAPAYHGADDYKFQPLPMVDIKWGRFFVNFQDGIGANLFDSENVTVGVGFTMADGYRKKDAPAGIGKLSTGLGGRGFVKLRQAGFEATLGATKIITGSTEGVVADAALAYPIMVSQKMMLMPSIGTTWGNRKHNNRYFGVTAAQSAASGLAQYRAGSGLIDAKAELALIYRITDRIGVMAMGGVSSLQGDAKDSPIVVHRTRPYGLFALTYSF